MELHLIWPGSLKWRNLDENEETRFAGTGGTLGTRFWRKKWREIRNFEIAQIVLERKRQAKEIGDIVKTELVHCLARNLNSEKIYGSAKSCRKASNKEWLHNANNYLANKKN